MDICEFWSWTLVLILLSLLFFVHFYFKRKYSFWIDLGIDGPPPLIPFGILVSYALKGHAGTQLECSQKYGKIYGVYIGSKPLLVISDPELIKQVMVKDFNSFMSRIQRQFDHQIMNSNLSHCDGEQWRRIRAITTPTFTAAKLKEMNVLMDRAVDKLANYFEKVITGHNDGRVNVKEVMIGFAIDVFAASAFATDTDANGNRDKSGAFLKHCLNLHYATPWKVISRFALPIKFNKLFGNNSGTHNDEACNFLVEFSREIIKRRKMACKNSKEKRNDLLQLLLDSRVCESNFHESHYEQLIASTDVEAYTEPSEHSTDKNFHLSMKGLTDDEIIAQCIIFFIAGFGVVSATLSACLYNLAINSKVQQKLHDNLKRALNGMDSTSEEYYETVMTKLPLLEAVVKETLRLIPSQPETIRQLNADYYTLAGVPLHKGQLVYIPIYAVHHNPEYYPEPEKFQPDRFMPENKHLLVPYTYLPFGVGPRNCIGMRFAYQEIKLCLAKIVRLYRFSPTSETPIPLKFTKVGSLSCHNIPLSISKA